MQIQTPYSSPASSSEVTDPYVVFVIPNSLPNDVVLIAVAACIWNLVPEADASLDHIRIVSGYLLVPIAELTWRARIVVSRVARVPRIACRALKSNLNLGVVFRNGAAVEAMHLHRRCHRLRWRTASDVLVLGVRGPESIVRPMFHHLPSYLPHDDDLRARFHRDPA
jgi:hypothetical protein